MKIYIFIVALLLWGLTGCNAPQRITDDINIIATDSKAISDFNVTFLTKAKTSTPEELEKKLKLLTASQTAQQRVERALFLLKEYLSSTEYVNESQLAVTDEIIRKIADKVNERLQE